jgi:hypothetical protein
LKRATREWKHTKMARYKLFIDGELYVNENKDLQTISSQTEFRDAVMTPRIQSTNSKRP